MRSLPIWPLGAVLLALAAPVPGQSRQATPIRPVGFLDYGASLILDGEASFRERQSRSSVTREEQSLFTEKLELSADGYAYHPNFLQWHVRGLGGLTQERLKINEDQFNTNGTLLGYDVSALLLRQKPVSFRAFASRNESVQDRDFRRNTLFTRQRTGGQLLTKGPLSFSLLGERIDSTDEGDQRTTEARTDHMRFSVREQHNPDLLSELIYDREDTDSQAIFVEDGAVEDLSGTADEVTFQNNWRFGPGPEKHSLTGQVRSLKRTGVFPQDGFFARERLDLVHTKTFSTFYIGRYDDDETDSDRDRLIRAEIGFRKKFYESLDLTGRAYADDQEFLLGSQKVKGAGLDADYRKNTPIGKYTSRLRWVKEFEEQQFQEDQRTVRNEMITLNDTTYVALSRTNVIDGTIVVTDATNVIRYVENVDYELRRTGQTVEIARKIGGAIDSGDTVLVDYAVRTPLFTEFTTDEFRWNNRIALDKLPLALYADFGLRDETLRSGDDPNNLERHRMFLAGAEVSYKGLEIRAEHETHDRELSPPTESLRGQVAFRHALGREMRFAVGARAERLEYKQAQQFGFEPGRDFEETVGGYAELTSRLGRYALIRFRSDASDSRGRTIGNLLRNRVSLEWKRGQIEFTLDAEYNMYERETNSGDEASVKFHIKRRF